METNMSQPIFMDVESCGLHGPITLIQYAEGDGDIILYEPWRNPIGETINLFEKLANHPDGIVGFNLVFDWFHVYQMWTSLQMLRCEHKAHEILEDCLDSYPEYEDLARNYKDCLKPVKAHDVMLHARKTSYQSLMDRKDVIIRRVPAALAVELAEELERRVEIKDIYFSRRKTKGPKWRVEDTQDDDFKNVVLRFAPSGALKTLAADALNEKDILYHKDISIGKDYWPEELGYAPFAEALSKDSRSWPKVIRDHIIHWQHHSLARKYAENDVKYTRALYKYFGSPELGDDDSELACSVACCRWRGYAIDRPKVERLKEKMKERLLLKDPETGELVKSPLSGRILSVPVAPKAAAKFVKDVMSEEERVAFGTSTKKRVLEDTSALEQICPKCEGEGLYEIMACDKCNSKGLIRHPAATRAEMVLNARKALKEIELYDKLLRASRFHASFKIIGTLSSRMSGADGLNPQGIRKTEDVRSCFPLADHRMQLCIGDFSGFEVTLAEACYNDINLRKDLMSGKKIHALFGVHVFPHMSYEAILATDQTENDIYTKCKQAVFALFYGGDENTLADRLGVPLDVAKEAVQKFYAQYPGVKIAREKIERQFRSMVQPGGIGTKVIWKEPSDYAESMFGFRRYFTLENKICKALFELANKPPQRWQSLKIKVTRRDREQTVGGAIQSALYGAAFNIQSHNLRAAINHQIQSSGATITKALQRKIWDLQPSGVSPWLVQPMNCHDEVICPCAEDYVDTVAEVVKTTVESFRSRVPLIKMPWKKNVKNWAEK